MKTEKDPAIENRISDLRNLLLGSLIRDHQPRQIYQSDLNAAVGLTLPTEDFILIRTDIIDPADDAEPSVNSPVAQMTYREVLDRIEETFLGILNNDRTAAYFAMLDESMYFLISLKQPVDLNSKAEIHALKEELRAGCLKAQDELWSALHIRLQQWGSDLFTGLERICSEYESFRKEDLCDLDVGGIQFAEDRASFLAFPGGKTAQQMMMLERKIISAAIDHDFRECYDAFRRIMEIESGIYPACNHVADRAFERLITIFAVAGIPRYSTAYPELSTHVWRKELQNANGPEECYNIVKDVLTICEEYLRPPQAPIADRTGEIVTFINDNLFNPDLCADMICERFGISLSYLSRIFKESQNIKLIDYIHSCRIRASFVLLRQTEPALTVDQVAEKLGYTSALTFTRAFKRVMGMTPGSYRRVQSDDKLEKAGKC